MCSGCLSKALCDEIRVNIVPTAGGKHYGNLLYGELGVKQVIWTDFELKMRC